MNGTFWYPGMEAALHRFPPLTTVVLTLSIPFSCCINPSSVTLSAMLALRSVVIWTDRSVCLRYILVTVYRRQYVIPMACSSKFALSYGQPDRL